MLTAAGQELATLQDGNSESTYRVIVEGAPRMLSPRLEDEVYRIGREIIRNAFRHADARQIEVEIRYDNQRLRLRIRDDGRGIDAKVLDEKERMGHWGLAGIRERAQRIGSRLDIWSEAGAGTEVQLTVPAAIAYQNSSDSARFGIFRQSRKS
jgi:signal transduction histidine kinase